MSRFAKGCIFDPAGHMVSGAHHVMGAVAPKPSHDAFSLMQYAPPEGDQDQASACTGFASATACQITLYKNAAGIWLISRPAGYTWGRCIDRDNVRVKLTDDGAMPNQVARGYFEWGISFEKDWPFVLDAINADPTELQIQRASGVKLKKPMYRINEDPDRDYERFRNRLAQLLEADISPMFSCEVDSKHEDWDGSGQISAPTEDLGGHMLCCTGYTDQGNGIEWKGSWSRRWGRNGYGYGDESFIRATKDWYFFVG